MNNVSSDRKEGHLGRLKEIMLHFTLRKTSIAPGGRPSKKGNLFSNPSVSGASCQFQSLLDQELEAAPKHDVTVVFLKHHPKIDMKESIGAWREQLFAPNRLVPNRRWRPFSSQRELRHKSCWSWLILRELWRRFAWGPFFRKNKKRDKVEASSCYCRVINKMGIYIVRLKFPTTQLGFQSEETSANPSLKPHKTLNIKPSWTFCNMKYSVSLGRIFQQKPILEFFLEHPQIVFLRKEKKHLRIAESQTNKNPRTEMRV